MKRSDLVDVLKKAAPALAAKELVPAFSNFFFDGQRVQAWDGIVAIQTPCTAEVKGGIRGKLLMDFLAASRAPEVLFEAEDGKVRIKAAKAKLDVGLDSAGDFKFTWPDAKAVTIEASDALMAAMKACSTTMGLDPSNPALLGITVEIEPEQILLYSATNLAMTCCNVAVKPPKGLHGKTLVLPVRFCELLMARGRPESIAITSDWVEARYQDGTRVHSASVGAADPGLFRKVIERVEWKQFSKVPKGIDGCINRAVVVLSGDETQHCTLLVKEDRLRMETVGAVGHSTDYVLIEKHEPIEVRVRPSLILGPLEHSDRMRIFKTAIAFQGPNYRSMVSVASA